MSLTFEEWIEDTLVKSPFYMEGIDESGKEYVSFKYAYLEEMWQGYIEHMKFIYDSQQAIIEELEYKLTESVHGKEMLVSTYETEIQNLEKQINKMKSCDNCKFSDPHIMCHYRKTCKNNNLNNWEFNK